MTLSPPIQALGGLLVFYVGLKLFSGGMIKYVCITDSKWVVSGHTIGDGAIATPFT